MKNKKKIIIISISIIFLILIICFILFNSNKTEFKKSKTINNIEFSNLKIVKENDIQIVKFTIQNKNNKKYTLGLVAIHLLNNDKELLIIPITIESLKENEKKIIEYIIEEDLYNQVNDFYVTTYVSYDEIEEEEIDDSLENKLANILKTAAKNIVNNLDEEIEDTLTLTAYTMEFVYKENIDEFKKPEYKCSLDNSFIEVVKLNDNEYEYISYIDCEVLYDK